MSLYFLIILFPFLLTVVGTKILTENKGVLPILDNPNPRSLHNIPTPRTGGIVIMFSISVTLLVLNNIDGVYTSINHIMLTATSVALVSFFDDIYDVSAKYRFIIHLFASSLFVIFIIPIESSSIVGLLNNINEYVLLSVFVIFLTWVINLYNFMDGIDGMASTASIVGFIFFAALGYINGNVEFFLFTLIIAASYSGFVIFNFPPAKIFLGDLGSSTTGFLAGASILWAVSQHIFTIWQGILVFMPFLLDTTITLFKRIAIGRNVWEAHNEHYYQEMMKRKIDNRTVLLIYNCSMAISGGAALLLVGKAEYIHIVTLLMLSLLFYLCLRFTLNHNKKYNKNIGI